MPRSSYNLKNTFFLVSGILLTGMGLKGFLLSSRFIDGGVTGISMLLAETLGIPLSVLIFLLNVPFIAIGYRQVGKEFAIKSTIAIIGLGLCLALIPFPDVTQDKFLTAAFGGLFIGAGIGLVIRGGGVLDGTEIVALLVSKSSHFLRVGDVILILNVFIFLAAAFFLGVESALYSIITYFTASKMVDFILHGIDEYTAIIIVSPKSEEMREGIVTILNRSVTVYHGKGGATNMAQDILYCVVTRLEIGSVKELAREIDGNAFIVTHPLSDAEGGVTRRGRVQKKIH